MTKILTKCDFCGKDFYKSLKNHNASTNYYKHKQTFCSHTCRGNARRVPRVGIRCHTCDKELGKMLTEKELLSKPVSYCSAKCYFASPIRKKKVGYRRSKLELYLEDRLPTIFPLLEFHFNKRDTINSELDIYVPSLKLAFELNGAFHYEPIFGKEQLEKIQNNDNRKFQACLEKGIELCIIDSSKLGYFKEKNAKPFLDIVVSVIAQKSLRK